MEAKILGAVLLLLGIAAVILGIVMLGRAVSTMSCACSIFDGSLARAALVSASYILLSVLLMLVGILLALTGEKAMEV